MSSLSVVDLASWLQTTFGGIDILINNAGISKKWLEVYEDYAVEIVEANYFGTKRVTEKLLPLLRASPHGARIVTISSQIGHLQEFADSEDVKDKVQEAVDRLDKTIVDRLATKYLFTRRETISEGWAITKKSSEN